MNELIKYDIVLHFKDCSWDRYEVNAAYAGIAGYTAVNIVVSECGNERANQIDLIRIYGHNSGELLKEYQVTE